MNRWRSKALRRAVPRLGALALLLALGACTTTGIHQDVQDSDERWRFAGKIGIRTPSMSESAYLNWQQCGPRFDIRLTGPLGGTVARFSGTPQAINVVIDEREPFTSDRRDIQWRLQQELGWSIPLASLRYWVRGQAAPTATTEAAEPTPAVLEQGRWQVHYLRYHEHGNLRLPAKLRVSDAQVNATLIIKQWSAPDCGE